MGPAPSSERNSNLSRYQQESGSKANYADIVKHEDPSKLFSIGERVGEGALSHVVKVARLQKKRQEQIKSRQPLCAKIIDIDGAVAKLLTNEEFTRNDALEFLHTELEVLYKARTCKFIVTFFDAYEFDGQLWIICELCTPGSIGPVLLRVRGFTDEECAAVLYCLLQALKYIHEMGYIHGDVKLENVLIDDSGNVKLSDFGGASKCDESGRSSSRYLGTWEYMPPEILQGYTSSGLEPEYSQKRDIWAVGALALLLKDGTSNITDAAEFGIEFMYHLIVYGHYYDSMLKKDILQFYFPDENSEVMNSFVKASLVVDPESRPTAKELLRHSLFKTYEIEQNYQSSIRKMLQRFKEAPPPKVKDEQLVEFTPLDNSRDNIGVA